MPVGGAQSLPMEPVTLSADGLRLVAWEQRHMADLARIYADPLIERFLVMPLPWAGTARERFVWLQERHWQGGQPPLGGGERTARSSAPWPSRSPSRTS